MRSHLLSALTIGAMLAVPSVAHAESFSLHLEPGVSGPLTAPQDNIYSLGPRLAVKPLFTLTNWLAVGPDVDAAYFPRLVDNGENAGVLWQLGGDVRFQLPRNYNDVSPYLDLNLTGAHTGNIWFPMVGAQVGAEAALDDDHSTWLGAYIGYQHGFQTASEQDGVRLNREPPNFLTTGMTLSFDYPHRRHVVVQTKTVYRNHITFVTADNGDKQHDKVCPALPSRVDVGRVYFNWDSAKLRNWEQTDKIDQVVALLKAHPEATVRVEGNASSDGQKQHNQVLSENRAASVVQYLVQHGVDASRINSSGNGIDSPAADNSRQEGRERNRRVEFVVNFTAVNGK